MTAIRYITELANDYFGKLIPDRVLLEYNGPHLFTFTSPDQKRLLAYLCDEDEVGFRYIVVPSSDTRVERMLSGTLAISAALDQAWGWVVDVAGDQVRRVYQMDLDELPLEYKPEPNAYLPGTRQAELTIRLHGENLSRTTTPEVP